MSAPNNASPSSLQSIRIAPQQVAKRSPVKFKFAKAPKPEVHEAKVHLKHGGVVKVAAVRNPASSVKIQKKGEPGKENGGNWACRIVHWTGDVVTRDAVILNANFDDMYPGATYEYASIANGSYKSLPYARKPLTINVDGIGFRKPAVKVAHPSKANIRQAIAEIKASERFHGGTRTFGWRGEVLSDEHLFLKTGGSGSFMGFGGSHDFNYRSNEKSHKYYLEIAQAYYTISVDDDVHEPSDFFVMKSEQPGNRDALAEQEVDPDWVFVESVTYGRLLQVMFECDESLESTGFDIEAHVDWLVLSAEANFSRKTKNLLSRSNITVAGIGGKADLAGKVVNSSFSDLHQRIDAFFGGKDDEVPIAYTLRTLDGAVVGTRMATDFTSRQCAPIAHKYKVTWTGVHCRNSDDADGAEDTKLFVRMRAWDGKGRDIVDLEGKNKYLLSTPHPKRLPWTFIEGSEEHDIPLDTNESRSFHHSLTFPIPTDDTGAKFAIRADVLEFDDTSDNDDFADQAKAFTVAEVGDGRDVTLLSTDDDSRIEFKFRIEPVF
jgi:thiol-activated cytolysin